MTFKVRSGFLKAGAALQCILEFLAQDLKDARQFAMLTWEEDRG